MSNSQNGRNIRGDATEHNKPAQHGEVTQKNESRRTPESRSDRENHVGGANQTQARQARMRSDMKR